MLLSILAAIITVLIIRGIIITGAKLYQIGHPEEKDSEASTSDDSDDDDDDDILYNASRTQFL